jgi:cytoskeletal protein RodZ
MNYPPIRMAKSFTSFATSSSKHKYSILTLFLILISISILGVLLSSRSKEMFTAVEKFKKTTENFGDQQSSQEQKFNSPTFDLLSRTPDASLIPTAKPNKETDSNSHSVMEYFTKHIKINKNK